MQDPNNHGLFDSIKNEAQRIFSPDNVVFSGGFGLAVIAAGAQVFRSSYKVGIQLLKRNFLVTLEVTSKDRSYPWVLQWLAVKGTRTQHLSVETIVRSTQGNKTGISFDLVPGPGQHLLQYSGRIFLVQRVREQQMVDLNSGKPWEKVLFTTIGKNTTVFDRLLQDAYDLSSSHEEGKTLIYTNWGSEWRQFGQPRRKRPLESVILDELIAERLTHDVNEWINSSKWYIDRGIPYRRGYLLHGPPGSGKSSFIFALAGKLNYNICILNLSERGLTDERLGLALSCVPPQSIVLLEDIDAAFSNREDNHPDFNPAASSSNVTFSGLLNVLDGVAASEERLVFMTTNHIDRLDKALIRPGRIDYVQYVGDATDYQIKRLFQNFYSNVTEEETNQFLHHLRSKIPKVSMAALQGYLLRHKESSQRAMDDIDNLVHDIGSREKEKPKDSEVPTIHRKPREVKPRPVKPLTAEQVDKMYFNPQAGWDKDL
eukprot:gene7923-8563_t